MVVPLLVFIGERLKRIPGIGKLVDERFMSHRLRAQRSAGLIGFLVADALFGYCYLVKHIWNWELLVIVLTTAGAYFVLIVWYLFTE